MVDPILVGAGLGVVAVGVAAGYAYLTGEDTSASVDVDDDGNNEATISFGGEEPPTTEYTETVDPTPEVVKNTESLTDIKGIGPTRADELRSQGLETPEDIYYASDETLNGVHGLGPTAITQIREDIGGVDIEGDVGNASTKSDEQAQSTSSSTEQSKTTDGTGETTNDGQSGDEATTAGGDSGAGQE